MGKGKSSRRQYIENFDTLGVPIPWDDFVYLLTRHFGFEMENDRGGSGFTFIKEPETFTAYRPHKKGMKERFVHKADRQKAIRALRNLDLI